LAEYMLPPGPFVQLVIIPLGPVCSSNPGFRIKFTGGGGRGVADGITDDDKTEDEIVPDEEGVDVEELLIAGGAAELLTTSDEEEIAELLATAAEEDGNIELDMAWREEDIAESLTPTGGTSDRTISSITTVARDWAVASQSNPI
jgi:hypothetical protein